MNLTSNQIEQFNNDGFLVLKDFVSHEFCDEITKKAKNHLEQKISPIESEQEYLNFNDNKITVRRLRQVYDREDIFKEWMTYKKIRPILKQLLNDEIVLTLAHHNSIMTKLPKESTRTYWHQDRRYWHYENDNLISVWLALDDEFIENGLLEFIPSSHKMSFSSNRFDNDSNFLDENEENIALINKKVSTPLQKGDVVLFHCKTLHHANKNNTKKAKISFVYTVRGKNNKPLTNTRSDFKEIELD